MNPKLLFQDIRRGYSVLKGRAPTFYLKHISHVEICELEEVYQAAIDDAILKGVPCKKEKEKEILENGLWKDEKKLKDEIFLLQTYQTNIKKTAKITEIRQLRNEIEKTNKIILDLQNKKNNCLGKTAEWFGDKKMNEEFLFLAAKKDPDLKLSYYTREQFDEDLDHAELYLLSALCKNTFDLFNERNLRKIALSGFFREYFGLTDNDPVKFYGRPVLDLTYNQSRLFYHGMEMTHVLKEIGNKLPLEKLDDPDAILDYYTVNQNYEELKAKAKDGNVNPVGFKKEDMQAVGIQHQVANVGAMLKKYGDNMNMEQMIKEGIL